MSMIWTEDRSCYFRPVEDGDVEAFAARMREADRRELRRWTGNSPAYELGRAVELSEALWVGCLPDGTRLSMFGGKRTNLVDCTGCIWELSTEDVNAHRFTFARASRRGMDMVMRSLPSVEEFRNYVDAEYDAAVRWIEWLGGTVSVGGGFRGRCGGRFLEFYILNPHYKEELCATAKVPHP